MQVRTTGCCALRELVDISTEPTPEAILQAAIRNDIFLQRQHYTANRVPFILFTSVTERQTGDHASSRTDNYGQALADYITNERLGDVVTTLPPRLNYTGNAVKVWLWMPNYGALWEWGDQHPIQPRDVSDDAIAFRTVPVGQAPALPRIYWTPEQHATHSVALTDYTPAQQRDVEIAGDYIEEARVAARRELEAIEDDDVDYYDEEPF